MATLDITRSAFQPGKHYDGVRMQQGRVLNDDDFNESEVIDHEDRRRARVEIIGPSGTSNGGFAISDPSSAGGKVNFTIAKGSMFVGGLRVELAADIRYRAQRDWLRMPDADAAWDGRPDLVYLEVWQQEVSAVEDSELLETALGGPDTAGRVRTMYRVRRMAVDSADCALAWTALAESLTNEHKGTLDPATGELVPDVSLTVSLLGSGASEDLCSPSVTAGYLGANNTAIRVELVPPSPTSGKAAALTWGFDNASPLYRVTVGSDRKLVTFQSLPTDEAHWPSSGQTVEVLPWSALLANGEIVAELAGQLGAVATSYDTGTSSIRVVADVAATLHDLSWTPAGPLSPNLSTDTLFLRVWDRGTDTTSPVRLEFNAGETVTLGDTGLQVTITGADLSADAHWIIAARPSSPDVVVPWELFEGKAPEGVRRFYAPLAIIQWDSADPSASEIHDCRATFQPLTRSRGCCTVTVGDGSVSFGDYDKIQDAINGLPEEGGTVCILRGSYEENVSVRGRSNVTIHGCGAASVLSPADAGRATLTIDGSEYIDVHDLFVTATETDAIVIKGGAALQGLKLHDLDIDARDGCGILGHGEPSSPIAHVQISRCRLRAKLLEEAQSPTDPDGKWPLVYLARVSDARIEECEITAVTSVDKARIAAGGIQIGGESDRIEIKNNRIQRGTGRGVTLGSVRWGRDGTFHWPSGFGYVWVDDCLELHVLTPPDRDGGSELKPSSDGPLDGVLIEGNQILDMAADGIGVARFWSEAELLDDAIDDALISVTDLTIRSNRIERCVQAEIPVPRSLVSLSAHGGVALADVDGLLVRDNVIAHNGANDVQPVCGVFVLQGRGISIDQNRIVQNGPQAPISESTIPAAGARGGVVIYSASSRSLSGSGRKDGEPSVRVHDNVVVSPEGQALWIEGKGAMSIVANQLTAMGRGAKTAWVSGRLPGAAFSLDGVLVGSAVHIANTGTPSDTKSDVWKKSHFAVTVPGKGQDGDKEAVRPKRGRVKRGRSEKISQSDSFVYRGKYNPPDGEPQIELPAVQFDSPEIGEVFSLGLDNGEVLFDDNQVLLDLRDEYDSRLFASIVITSADDVSFQDNQARCTGDFVHTNAFLAAWTLRAAGNRFREQESGATFSALTYGGMNTTTDNQGTHCFVALAADAALLVEMHNKVLYSSLCENNASLGEDLINDVFFGKG